MKMAKFETMDEDSLLEAIEFAETEKDFETIVGILKASCSESKPVEDCETVAEAACDAMLRASSRTENATAFETFGASEAICSAMKRFAEQPAIIEVCCGVIKDLASSNIVNQNNLAEAGATKLLVTSMNYHTDGEATLQEQACLAVESLSKGNAKNAKLLVDAGIKTSLEQAKGLITNDRNKTYPDIALACINAALGE
mmetsp:Transcript_4605/g.5817  ORF Transcript_4605/g.5817 Transcript_4605/m.5817 type:complete len:199 (-) Transcript_4605:1518-2114(-)